MIQRFIVFNDCTEDELAPMTEEQFSQADFFGGSNDMAWASFKRVMKWREIEDFNDETMQEGYKIVLKYRGEVLDIKSFDVQLNDCVGDEYYQQVFKEIDNLNRDLASSKVQSGTESVSNKLTNGLLYYAKLKKKGSREHKLIISEHGKPRFSYKGDNKGSSFSESLSLNMLLVRLANFGEYVHVSFESENN